MENQELTLEAFAKLVSTKNLVPSAKLTVDYDLKFVEFRLAINQPGTSDLVKDLEKALKGEQIYVSSENDLDLLHKTLAKVNAPVSNVSLRVEKTCDYCQYQLLGGDEEYLEHIK